MTHAQQQQHLLWTDRYLKLGMMEAHSGICKLVLANATILMWNLLLAMLLNGQRLKVFYKVHPIHHEPTALAGVGYITLADLSHFH